VKNQRSFRILVIAMTLVLLLVAMPTVPVAAVVTVNVNPSEGEIGDNINLFGFGTFSYEYYIFFSSQNADLADEIDDEVTAYNFLVSVNAAGVAGAWSATNILVPSKLTDGADDESVHSGTYYFYMTSSLNKTIEAKTTFTLTGAAGVTDFSPDKGAVGTEVKISGEGLAPNEDIIVEYDGDEIDIDAGDEEADNNGEFTLYIIIPESEYGEHTITIIGENSLVELEETFSIEPEISINPLRGKTGSVITVTGTGFDRLNGVDFSFGGTTVTGVVWLVESTGRTNSDGTFAVNLTVPDIAPGSYVILAEDENDNDIFSAKFYTIEAAPIATPTVTLTTTITTTTLQEPTTITTTITAEPTTITIPTTITATVTAEPTTATIPTTITKTITAEPTTTPASEGSNFNIWIPIASALGAMAVLLIGFILYLIRSKQL